MQSIDLTHLAVGIFAAFPFGLRSVGGKILLVGRFSLAFDILLRMVGSCKWHSDSCAFFNPSCMEPWGRFEVTSCFDLEKLHALCIRTHCTFLKAGTAGEESESRSGFVGCTSADL